MVEKSEKKPFCAAKYGKNRMFLGDRLLEPKRGTSNINDLRAPQATPGVDRVLDMLLSAKLESLAGELPPPECAEGGANPTESTDARASVTRVELTYQTAFYKSYLAAFARI